MNTQEKKLLVEAFKAAEKAAVEADPGQDGDGGSCNFDSPSFRVKGIQEKTVDKLAEEAGVRVTSFNRFGSRAYWLRTTTNGQAMRRTTMAEAATRALRSYEDKIAGFTAFTYYQVD